MSGKQHRTGQAPAPMCSEHGECIDANAMSSVAPYGNAAVAEQIAKQTQRNSPHEDADAAAVAAKGASGLGILGTVARMGAEKLGDLSGGAAVYNALAGAAAET